METFATHRQAHAASDESQQVCGTFVGKNPVYFLMPTDATDTSVRDAAFELRRGREISDGERRLLRMAEAWKGTND